MHYIDICFKLYYMYARFVPNCFLHNNDIGFQLHYRDLHLSPKAMIPTGLSLHKNCHHNHIFCRYMRFPTMWYVRPHRLRLSCAYAQSDQSLCLSLEYYMTVKLPTEHHLVFLSLKGCCTGLSESTQIKCHIVGNHMSRLIYMSQCMRFPTMGYFDMCRLGRTSAASVKLRNSK